ncbi:MAG: NADH-quinone oxidoreductase subunit L [Thermogutta sp.]
MEYLIVFIPMMPLAAAFVTALLGRRVLQSSSHVPTVTAAAAAFIASIVLLLLVYRASAASEGAFATTVRLWSWADIRQPLEGGAAAPLAGAFDLARFHIAVTLRADPLTAVMLVTVTAIALLVAVYSIGYMHDDPGYWRFFTYISLFLFSMTMLVSVSNFALLYVFWEAVGLCSYLLIGFWYQKPEAAAAGKKAFLVNRVGDFGFALGIFLLWSLYGTLDFHDTWNAQTGELISAGILGGVRTAAGSAGYLHGGVAAAIALLLFVGACGKSAQFPLHVWLPDAMEGPTPVSALIHAATMVTAGVYMVARCMPLFEAAPIALAVIGGTAGFTALLAAFIALTQNDLKRILAYSTISQLGYMFLGLSVGGLVGAAAGMFHLFTHAFFKALLFLGAGSVMHAMGGVIDLERIGGLRRRLPWTYAVFLVGCLALAGVFPLAGFFSKDQVLIALYECEGGPVYRWLFYAGLAGALMTAFYTFRAFFRTFHGQELVPVEAGRHAHESPWIMLGPLVILAAASVTVGPVFGPTGWFEGFLSKTPGLAVAAEHAPHALAQTGQGAHALTAGHDAHHLVALWSTLAALAGIGGAMLLYLGPAASLQAAVAAARTLGLYALSYRKVFFDELYGLVLVRPLRGLAAFAAWFDRYVIDCLADLVGLIPKAAGALLRDVQTGFIPWYASAMMLGVLALLAALVLF